MPDQNKYKLLISGELVQQSAFSNGGRDDLGWKTVGGSGSDNSESMLDMPLARNGKGDCILRGTSLAGAFIATARQLVEKEQPSEEASLPLEITEDTPSVQYKEKIRKTKEQLEKELRMKESVWIFHHAHIKNEQKTEIRDEVAISHKTGAARDGAKFDLEVLPAGTRWHFLMEVDQYRDDSGAADAIAVAVAKEWENGCWLGRQVARGLGWMKLENLTIHQLNLDQVPQWPNAKKTPYSALKELKGVEKIADLPLPEGWVEKERHLLMRTIKIEVGTADQGYGLDMLSVGSFQEDPHRSRKQHPKKLIRKTFLEQHPNNLIKPLGQNQQKYLEFSDSKTKNVDFNLAVTQTHKGSQPFIPGSSLRGSLRHALSWLLRRQGKEVWEPGDPLPPDTKDLPLKLFGSTQESARLLVSDAMLIGNDWEAVVLEMHAEDEFTQGAYGGSKFDRTALTRGKFEANLYLQAESEEELDELRNGLEQLQTLANNRRIPLGGGEWKGLGWVKIEITPP